LRAAGSPAEADTVAVALQVQEEPAPVLLDKALHASSERIAGTLKSRPKGAVKGTCGSCGKDVTDSDERTKSNGQYWHKRCTDQSRRLHREKSSRVAVSTDTNEVQAKSPSRDPEISGCVSMSTIMSAVDSYNTLSVETWLPRHVREFICGIDSRLVEVGSSCFERGIGGKLLLTLPRDELARRLSIHPLLAARILVEVSRARGRPAFAQEPRSLLKPHESSLERVVDELESMSTTLERFRPFVEQALGSATSDVARDALLAVQAQSEQIASQAAAIIKNCSPTQNAVGRTLFKAT
jgi:hypothetical protein